VYYPDPGYGHCYGPGYYDYRRGPWRDDYGYRPWSWDNQRRYHYGYERPPDIYYTPRPPGRYDLGPGDPPRYRRGRR
jgi:hypothetical protein